MLTSSTSSKRVRVWNPFREMYLDLGTGTLGGDAILQVTCEGIGFCVTEDQAIDLANALTEWVQEKRKRVA